MAFNGEIYNHLELRGQIVSLTRVQWRGHSDTETLLAGFDVWGIRKTIELSVGMFAMAVWDKQERELTLIRDRLGEKPLYYGWQGNSFIFASELKAIRQHPDFENTVNRDAIGLLLRHNYITAPYSIYRGISKLLPGALLKISLKNRCASPTRYWSVDSAFEYGDRNRFAGSPMEAVDQLESLVSLSVKQKMIADVPLGAFLSGGIDSSTVVALLQAQSNSPVNTFTIGFDEHGYNEAHHAKVVAGHLNTSHTELYVTAQEAMSVIPKLPSMFDEPFSDSSQIPTFLVSQLAKQSVTVALSGDGGDELFFGYSRYTQAERIWGKLQRFPFPIRMFTARMMQSLPGALIEKWMKVLPERYQVRHFADRLPKLAEILSNNDFRNFYRELVSHSRNPSRLVLGINEPETAFSSSEIHISTNDHRSLMMKLDMLSYLPDDILTKVDRASMAVSLEARVPLLDHRIVEFACSLPNDLKYREGKGKWILREVLSRHVPRHLIERQKMGFGVPIEHWLKNELREWGESLLSVDRLNREGYFDGAKIKQMWDEHLSGKRRWHAQLWNILMFQAWLDSNHLA